MKKWAATSGKKGLLSAKLMCDGPFSRANILHFAIVTGIMQMASYGAWYL
jgi:hypothetical protein